jgi:uncharacterized protein
MKSLVLDSSALMAFFEGRAGAEKVEEILAQAVDRKHWLYMSVVNWGEVYYSVWRAHGEKLAREKIKEIAQLPIEIVGVDMELAEIAARLKAEHNLPYADCFAASVAHERRASLVTTDKDLDVVKNFVKILWA